MSKGSRSPKYGTPIEQVKGQVHGKWRWVLESFGVDPKHLKNEHGPCPMCGGKDRFRFDDNSIGSFFCSHCGAGDGFTFACLYTNSELPDVIEAISAKIGFIKNKPKITRSTSTPDRARAYLRNIYSGCTSELTVVKDYLSARSLIVPDNDVMEHPKMPYFRDGHLKNHYPAMVAMVRDNNGNPTSLHITYLDGPKKADIAPAKKTLPPIRPLREGAAIRLFPGRGDGVLGVAEGIETAIACNILFGIPVWSTLNADCLKNFEPPKGVSHLHVFADNDNSLTGQAAAYVLGHRVQRNKKMKATVYVPPVAGKDWNDILTTGFKESTQYIRDTHPRVKFSAQYLEDIGGTIGTETCDRRKENSAA